MADRQLPGEEGDVFGHLGLREEGRGIWTPGSEGREDLEPRFFGAGGKEKAEGLNSWVGVGRRRGLESHS